MKVLQMIEYLKLNKSHVMRGGFIALIMYVIFSLGTGNFDSSFVPSLLITQLIAILIIYWVAAGDIIDPISIKISLSKALWAILGLLVFNGLFASLNMLMYGI